MPDQPSEQLIDFVAGIRFDDLSAETVVQATTCFRDAIACGLFGATFPWSRIVSEEMFDEHAAGGCTVLGQDRRLPAPAAALCNGTAIHGFELDDLIAASVVHPGAAVVPAAFAAAEAHNASGARLVEAIVAGYEVMHRIGIALGMDVAHRGFHKTSLAAPAGAAIAAGLIYGLDRDQLRSAVGLACSAASGIKSFADGHGGGMVKRLHLGRAAEAGVQAAQLARRGFSGPPLALDSRFGLIPVFGGAGANSELLSVGLGDGFAVGDVWIKVFPICGWIQAVAQLAVELRGPVPLSAREVRSVRVGVSDYAARNNGEPAPRDTMGAQYSIPYCTAVALTGDPRDPEMFAEPMVANASLRELSGKVEVYVDADVEEVYPAKFGARLAVTLASGEICDKLVLECHGTPADPCTTEEHLEKFAILSRHQFSADRGLRLAELVSRLANLPSIRDVSVALGPESAANASPARKVLS